MNKGIIKVFIYCIIHLISMGYKEKTRDVISHMENGDVMEWIDDKYANDNVYSYIKSSLDYKALNKLFEDQSHLTANDFAGKFGIVADDAGLHCLMVLLIEAL